PSDPRSHGEPPMTASRPPALRTPLLSHLRGESRACEAGTVLVTVLWIVFVISIISWTLAASVRTEVATEMDAFDSERAFYMAKGTAETVFYAQSKKQDIATEHSPVRHEKDEYVFPFEDGEARVRFESST